MPTALISWAHESDEGAQARNEEARRAADERWLNTVLDLSAGLRVIGDVEAHVDFAYSADPVDWSRWGPDMIRKCDFVLVAVNKAWARRFEGREAPGRGAGATAEADELLGLFARDREAFDQKVILVLLPGTNPDDIPGRLHGRLTHVRVNTFDAEGLDDLLRRIYGRPKYELPPLRGSTPLYHPRLIDSPLRANRRTTLPAPGNPPQAPRFRPHSTFYIAG